MVIAGDRQHMLAIHNPNDLKYMMSLNANGTGTWTVKRTPSVQPVASHIKRRTVVSSQVLPHPPTTPLRRPFSRIRSNGCRSRCRRRRCCSTSYSPTSPRLTRIVQTVRDIYPVAMKITLGSGISCISSGSRGDDNGNDNDDNLDNGQQSRTPLALSVPCINRVIQTDMCAPDFRYGDSRHVGRRSGWSSQ
jgi:hypothetical protein